MRRMCGRGNMGQKKWGGVVVAYAVQSAYAEAAMAP